jgi:AraC-like DNA-binding protein
MFAEQFTRLSSTHTVPQGMKFDYWMSILRQSLWPVSEWNVTGDFKFELQEASLGCLTTMMETVTSHQSYRTRSDVERSGDRCYLLFANQEPWRVTHNSHSEHFLRGDCVLVDSQGELETHAPSGFHGVILKLPVGWVQSWLSNPDFLIGRRIAMDSKWGRAFSPIVSQLTPELAADPPLPPGVLADQLGAMLALIAGDADTRATSDLLGKIQDCIRQRCHEPQLTAVDVAATLDLPPRNLHRVLATKSLTFASELLEARVNVALQMLTSPSFCQLTNNEIAHRAGFLNVSHFTRVVRKRTGYTPLELRHPNVICISNADRPREFTRGFLPSRDDVVRPK